jgi:hypothetical protein
VDIHFDINSLAIIAAFYGNSDTDEDISIPGMNTSEQKSISKPAAEEDDFDFYG